MQDGQCPGRNDVGGDLDNGICVYDCSIWSLKLDK